VLLRKQNCCSHNIFCISSSFFNNLIDTDSDHLIYQTDPFSRPYNALMRSYHAYIYPCHHQPLSLSTAPLIQFLLNFGHCKAQLQTYFHNIFKLTKKEVAWRWDMLEQRAFNDLKERIMTVPVLTLPDEERPYRIEADSSDFTTGAVLSQVSPMDQKWHLVVFYLKSLSAVEWNYEIHDKEMLAIVHTLEEWRHFLEGAQNQLEIWTDHKNLEYFCTAQKLNHQQAHWSLYLSHFDFELWQQPGSTMGKPLSQRPDHSLGMGDNQNMLLLWPEWFAIRALEGLSTSREE
jgi:RNase H-like domain found in reverse transcriptase